MFIEPAEDDYAFFGMSAMDIFAKERAALHGYETVRRSVDESHGLLSDVFKVHGIEMRPPRSTAPLPERHTLVADLRESRGRP